jgi:hypothetical protein
MREPAVRRSSAFFVAVMASLWASQPLALAAEMGPDLTVSATSSGFPGEEIGRESWRARVC